MGKTCGAAVAKRKVRSRMITLNSLTESDTTSPQHNPDYLQSKPDTWDRTAALRGGREARARSPLVHERHPTSGKNSSKLHRRRQHAQAALGVKQACENVGQERPQPNSSPERTERNKSPRKGPLLEVAEKSQLRRQEEGPRCHTLDAIKPQRNVKMENRTPLCQEWADALGGRWIRPGRCQPNERNRPPEQIGQRIQTEMINDKGQLNHARTINQD